MGISVNFYDQVIYVTSPTTTVTVQQIYDAIRAAEDTPIGMNFEGLIDESAIFDLGGGAYTAISMKLSADWYLEFWDGVVLGTVKDGNIVGGDSNRPVRAAVGSADTAYQLGAQFGIQMPSGAYDDSSLKGLIIGLDE